ncbi:MAG: single-stranded DNA-binding protein [Candidatus Izemoplasmataceae bacterium]
MINRTVLVGRLTKDPELRYTQSNAAVAKFTLAVNRIYKTQNNEADFIQCVVWNKQAENVDKYVRKGSLVGVEGRIQTGYYDNEQGVRVYTTEVVCDSVQFLEPKNAENSGSQNDYSQNNYQNKGNQYQNNKYEPQNNENPSRENESNTPRLDDISEDDLPF